MFFVFCLKSEKKNYWQTLEIEFFSAALVSGGGEEIFSRFDCFTDATLDLIFIITGFSLWPEKFFAISETHHDDDSAERKFLPARGIKAPPEMGK